MVDDPKYPRRKVAKVLVDYIDLDIGFGGRRLDDLVKYLSELLEENPEAFIEEYEQYDSTYQRLYVEDIEDDETYQNRLKDIAYQEEMERQQYLRLKAKFEPEE